ncbi:MAG: hypothetical protein ACREQC_04835, partial [Candidatus Binataceae bacterium]
MGRTLDLTRSVRRGLALALAFSLIIFLAQLATAAQPSPPAAKGPFFLPAGDAAKIVTVTPSGEAEAGFTVITEAAATKERGPRSTIAKFG